MIGFASPVLVTSDLAPIYVIECFIITALEVLLSLHPLFYPFSGLQVLLYWVGHLLTPIFQVLPPRWFQAGAVESINSIFFVDGAAEVVYVSAVKNTVRDRQ